MEGMLWGVAAMCVKDAVKQPYIKGRDYQRNVRQVYRDVDNLSIAVEHVKSNCQGDDIPSGAQALFIKRAEKQLRDAYRTLKRDYPRKLGLSGLMEYSTTPGGEMNLLDIGKEANQTAKGLGDLLAEIRFAKLGKKPKDEEDPEKAAMKEEAPPPRRRLPRFDVPKYESAFFDDASSDQASVSNPSVTGSWSPPSPSTSPPDQSRKRPKAVRKRSYSASDHVPVRDRLLPPTSSSGRPWKLEGGGSSSSSSSPAGQGRRDRERALDNLQLGVDHVLEADDEEEEAAAMAHLQRSLIDVLRVQQTQGFAGDPFDGALGDAVEDLDDALSNLVTAATEKEKGHALKRVSRAFEDVDKALVQRRKHKERKARHQPPQLTAGSPASSDSSSRSGPHMHRGSIKWKQGSRERGSRRYSVH